MRHSFLHGPWLACLVMMMFTCSLQRVECHRERDGRWTAECWASHGRVSVSFQICILSVCSDIKTGASLLLIWWIFESMDFHSHSAWKQLDFTLFFLPTFNSIQHRGCWLLILWHVFIMPLRYLAEVKNGAKLMHRNLCISAYCTKNTFSTE